MTVFEGLRTPRWGPLSHCLSRLYIWPINTQHQQSWPSKLIRLFESYRNSIYEWIFLIIKQMVPGASWVNATFWVYGQACPHHNEKPYQKGSFKSGFEHWHCVWHLDPAKKWFFKTRSLTAMRLCPLAYGHLSTTDHFDSQILAY